MNILIIDDNLVCQIKTQMALEEIGYSASYIANNTTEAIDFINSKDIHLIIADIILENELIFELKNILLTKKIPCVFVTAAPIQDNYEKTKAFPNARFLLKPFQALSLLATIDSLNLGFFEQKEKPNGVYITGKFRQKVLIKYDEILWLEAKGNYTIIHTIHSKRHSIKKSLSLIASELDKRFLQVQRATFVNTEYINRVDFGQEEINLSGKIIKIGRVYRLAIATYMNNK